MATKCFDSNIWNSAVNSLMLIQQKIFAKSQIIVSPSTVQLLVNHHAVN